MGARPIPSSNNYLKRFYDQHKLLSERFCLRIGNPPVATRITTELHETVLPFHLVQL